MSHEDKLVAEALKEIRGSEAAKAVLADRKVAESSTADGKIARAVDLGWLFRLLTVVLPVLLPMIPGGAIAGTFLPVLLKILADLIGVPQSEVKALLEEASA